MAAPTRVTAVSTAFNTATTPKTASVAVLAGDLICVKAENEDSAGTFSTPTSTGLTFTSRGNVGTSAKTCRVAIWTAPIASAGTITVSLASAGGKVFGFVVTVWRNHGGVGNAGTVDTGGGATTGAADVPITLSGNNSAIDFGTADFIPINGTTTRVYRSINGSPATEDAYFFSSTAYSGYWAYDADTGASSSGTTVHVGESAPTGQKYSGVAIEILAGAGGGSSFTQSATDTITVSESLDRSLSLPRAISETLGVSESLTRSVASPRALTDALTITDAADRSLGRTVSATDALTISDVAARATQAFTRTVADSITLAEAVTAPVGHPRSATDALSITDAATRSALNNPRPVTDTVTVADNATSNGGGTPASTLINLPLTGAGT